ncbi:MAG: hypothetical protein ACK56W_08800 [Pirellula sp.]|jgi:hypothetical protein|nr:hypothetical protein [Pirellula sp.]
MTDCADNCVFGDDRRSGQRRCGRMTDGAVYGFLFVTDGAVNDNLFVTGGAVSDNGNQDKPRC